MPFSAGMKYKSIYGHGLSIEIVVIQMVTGS
jgi:hypothetical protein